jgi:hypothetical protein
MANVQTSSGSISISGGGGNAESEKQVNNSKEKESTDKQQMGICIVGAGGPCNGDSNFDGRDDRTGQCILSNGCSDGNSKNSQNKNANTTSTNSSPNSTSPIIDGIMLTNSSLLFVMMFSNQNLM